MAYIYAIVNNVNNKQYIGKTNLSLKKRFREHVRDSRKERCEKRPLYSAMNKYGIEHFSISLLEECPYDLAEEREKYWISCFNTYGANGYNATRGGDSKQLYNYRVIAKRYLEIRNEKQVAKEFECDPTTVRVACKELGVEITKNHSNPRRKLTSKDVEFIKSNYISGDKNFGTRALARKFGLSHSTICEIIKGTRYKETI